VRLLLFLFFCFKHHQIPNSFLSAPLSSLSLESIRFSFFRQREERNNTNRTHHHHKKKKMNGSDAYSATEAQYVRRHHKHEPRENQCTSALVKHIKAPAHLVSFSFYPLFFFYLFIDFMFVDLFKGVLTLFFCVKSVKFCSISAYFALPLNGILSVSICFSLSFVISQI